MRAFAILVVLAFAGLVAWLLIRRGLLPLERMTRTAEGIAARDI